jgi:hypothetical protein
MTNIFIDISILLEHRSQVAKGAFLGYYLTIESNLGDFSIMYYYFLCTMNYQS